MKKLLFLCATCTLAASAFLAATPQIEEASVSINNVEALANDEGREYDDAENCYCIVPAGRTGCRNSQNR